MSIYVARHGLSGANDGRNPAFGSPDAHLLPECVLHARGLGETLHTDFGINLTTDAVATSTFIRTKETAKEAGFIICNEYAVLDEVKHGLTVEEFHRMKETRILPLHVMNAAEQTLENPPEEKIWISHGLRVAAICQILGVYQDEERLFQRFCEVRILPIGE